MMIDRQVTLLKEILEKSYHINAGIKAEDESIILGAIEERELMLSEYRLLEKGELTETVKALLLDIQALDSENQRLLEQLMNKVRLMTKENKRQFTQLEKGKKIVNQYERPYSNIGGGYFDQKK